MRTKGQNMLQSMQNYYWIQWKRIRTLNFIFPYINSALTKLNGRQGCIHKGLEKLIKETQTAHCIAQATDTTLDFNITCGPQLPEDAAATVTGSWGWDLANLELLSFSEF